MKRVLKILFYNLFFFIALLFLMEIAIRITIPEIKIPGTDRALITDNVFKTSPGLTPNSSGKSSGILKYVDEHGFWKFSASQDSSDKSALFLGDSVTMGIGVENDSTFAGMMHSAHQINVLNSSLIGYTNEDYLNVITTLFSDNSNRHNLSEVYLFWCLNDVYDRAPYQDLGLNNSRFLDRALITVRNHSKLFQFLKHIALDRPKTYYLYDEQFYSADAPLFQQAIVNIIAIQDVLEEMNIPFTIVIFPFEYQLRTGATTPQDVLIPFLEEENINVLNLFPALENLEVDDHRELYLYGDGIHFSEKGHRVISEILSASITLE